MSSWQRMESAPLDGTKVDLWRVHIENGDAERITDCWYSGGNWLFDRNDMIGTVDGSSDQLEAYWLITHWMLPPAPPEDM
ncbi:hypothetical protein [Ochrobactrum sp. EDr1-4]|uniref:hypothetical protein n=1 Tax=Ochrobactrum sp. EDr1-4 TaxID=3368622 RepID=UPI003B9E48DB